MTDNVKLDQNEEQYQRDMEFASHMPVKNHLERLDLLINSLTMNLEYQRKFKDEQQNSLIEISQLCTDQFDDANKYLIEEYKRLMQDFHEQNALQLEQHNFLKQQVESINNDRIKLQQNVIVLENRVQEAEKELGFLQSD